MSRTAHSRNLRRNRLTDAATTFFITKSLLPKKPALDNEARETIVSAFEFGVLNQRIYLGAFVVMPDHWHALFVPRNPWTLGRVMHTLMSFIGARTSETLRRAGTSWQDMYHDTWIRTARQFDYIQQYIELNPVTKGLVELPEEWHASSAVRTDLVTEPWPYRFD